MNRSHLVPEQRTNKNGVTSIKWVKRDGAATKAKMTLPAPDTGKQEPLAPHADNAVLTEIIYGAVLKDLPTSRIRAVFDMIREDDEEVLPFVHNLLTTGTKTARAMARDAFRDDISGIDGAAQDMRRDPTWRDLCSWGTDITSNVMRGWSSGNVMEESGDAIDETAARQIKGGVARINGARMRSDSNVFPYSPTNTEYWRGVTALQMSGVLHPKMPNVGVEEMIFIAWAGAHDRIDLVIKTARERETIDVGTLARVLDSKDGAESLREGIL